MALILDGDDLYEVSDEDVEYEQDGSGFWLLASEDEDSEDFYEFCDVSVEPDEG